MFNFVQCVLSCLLVTVHPGGACSPHSWKCVMQMEHLLSESKAAAVHVDVSLTSSFRWIHITTVQSNTFQGIDVVFLALTC